MTICITDIFEMRSETPVVEDITMDGPRLTSARLDLKCAECGAPLILRKSKKFKTPFYGCSRFPSCRGTHGAKNDGRPNGIPADLKTKAARIEAHRIFDRIWLQGHLTRTKAYTWLRHSLALSEEDAHIGCLSESQCQFLIVLVLKVFPQVRTIWDRVREESPYEEPVLD